MKMGSTMRGISLMIKLMARESIIIMMARFTEETFRIIVQMVMGLRPIRMGLDLRVNLSKGRRRKVNSSGLMDRNTLEISSIMSCKDLGSMNGQMAENMKENGRATKCTERVYSRSLMEEFTKVLTETTRKTGEEFTYGLMEDVLRVNSTKANSMVTEFSSPRTAKGEKQSSKTASESDG